MGERSAPMAAVAARCSASRRSRFANFWEKVGTGGMLLRGREEIWLDVERRGWVGRLRNERVDIGRVARVAVVQVERREVERSRIDSSSGRADGRRDSIVR